MGYGLLDVSEVGPPEYPLLEVLHQSICNRPLTFNPAAPDLLTLIAHLEGNPVGLLVASGSPDRATFTIHALGVLPDYRRQHLARRMLDWARQHAEARRYPHLRLTLPPELHHLAPALGFPKEE